MSYKFKEMKYSHSSFSTQRSSLSAFTLVEVMLVVVIILIAIGIAVPSLRGTLGSTRMTDAVRSTIRTANYARSMSILTQTDCTLTFATNQISLSSPNGVLAERRLPDNVEISEFENLTEPDGTERVVIYSSSGMNDGFELTLSDSKNRSHTITCNAITGKVTVDDD